MKLKNGKKNLKKRFKIWNKKYIYDFQQYETIRTFGDNIYTAKINIYEAEMNQTNILKKIVDFNNKSRPRTIEGNDKKKIIMKVHTLFVKIENYFLMLPKVEYFQ